MARDHYDDDFEDFDDDEDFDDADFEEETPRERRRREKAEAKARKKRQKKARRRQKKAEMSDYADDDDYADDIDDQTKETADESIDDDESDDDMSDVDYDSNKKSSGSSFRDVMSGKVSTKTILLKYVLPPFTGIIVGLAVGAVLFGKSSNSSNQQATQQTAKGVHPVETIQHAYSLTDVINSISHAQVNTLQKQLAQLSTTSDSNGYSDDQFDQAKQAVSGINDMTANVINPFFDKVLTMPVTQSNKDQKSTALSDAVNNPDSASHSSSSSSQQGKQQSQTKRSSQAESSSQAGSSSSSAQPSKAADADKDTGDTAVSQSVAQDKAAQIFSQENDKISSKKEERTQIAGEILASGPANDLQQAGLKSGNAIAFEAGASDKTFTYVVAVPYSTKTKTVNAIFTMKIGSDKKIKAYHYVGYLNRINDQAKNFYQDLN